ncbi:MAG: RNA methyltransferase [Rhodocyclaceae bacterium]|nr:RNA methyltransferase [Rhodocyclaceae bacterium]
MKHLSSRDNPFVKHLHALAHSARERRETNETILDGVHLVQAALSAARPLSALAVSEHALAKPEVEDLLERAVHVPRYILSERLFAHVSPVAQPAGILAVLPVPDVSGEISADASLVVLDGVQDPGNLGTLIRTAAAAGVKDVILTAGCAQAWAPKVLRAAMGAHFITRVHEQADPRVVSRGFSGEILATGLGPESGDLYALDLRAPAIWLFGAEGQGLSAEVAALATRFVTIPMPGAIESLNVAAAAAICLFEQVRQQARTGAETSVRVIHSGG